MPCVWWMCTFSTRPALYPMRHLRISFGSWQQRSLITAVLLKLPHQQPRPSSDDPSSWSAVGIHITPTKIWKQYPRTKDGNIVTYKGQPVMQNYCDQQWCCLCNLQTSHTCSHCTDNFCTATHPAIAISIGQPTSNMLILTRTRKWMKLLGLQPFSLSSILVLDCSFTTTNHSFWY